MKPVHRDGMLVPVCPYCKVEGVLVRTGYGRRWECPMTGCDARVGVHRDSPRAAPLGTMARAALRVERMKAHAAFDPLWQEKPAEFPSRRAAYEWLAKALGVPFKRCHIGEFDEATCVRVLAAISALHEVPR